MNTPLAWLPKPYRGLGSPTHGRPHDLASELARDAIMALVDEAMLSPKPALVDGRGPGAHADMDLTCMLRSAHSLRRMFEHIAEISRGRRPTQPLRELLGRIGRAGERTMLAATGGINTHRGAIWALGLLVAGRAIAGTSAQPVRIAEIAADIANFRDRRAPVIRTHGSAVRLRYGVLGARAEAQQGFPHVTTVGLPALQDARRRGIPEDSARIDALLAIMSSLPDTCLLHRGGTAALDAARSGARRALLMGGSSTPAGERALVALERVLMSLNASPGGSADLLSACLFLDRTVNAYRYRTAWKP